MVGQRPNGSLYPRKCETRVASIWPRAASLDLPTNSRAAPQLVIRCLLPVLLPRFWNSVVVFPIPGGATRTESPSVMRPLASAGVPTDSCKSLTSSVRSMVFEDHLLERRNMSRSAAAAARSRRLSSSSDGHSAKIAPASPWRMTRWNESLCARCFHLHRFSMVNSGSLESRALAWSWQSQMPLSGDRRRSGVIAGSYRGPPGAAAQMWPATPTLISSSPSEVAPTVCSLHDG